MRHSLLAAVAAVATLAAASPSLARDRPTKPLPTRMIRPAPPPQTREPTNRELQLQIAQLSALVLALSDRIADLQDEVGSLYDQNDADHEDAVEGLQATCEAIVRYNNEFGAAVTANPEHACRFGNTPPIG